MAVTSRIKAVKAELFSLLEQTAALAGVQITRAEPPERVSREGVWLGRTTWAEEPANLGPTRKRDQHITARVFVAVARRGRDVEAVENRAYDLEDAIEETLRANPDLNGAARFGGITSGETETYPTDDGWATVLRLDCTYQARKG